MEPNNPKGQDGPGQPKLKLSPALLFCFKYFEIADEQRARLEERWARLDEQRARLDEVRTQLEEERARLEETDKWFKDQLVRFPLGKQLFSFLAARSKAQAVKRKLSTASRDHVNSVRSQLEAARAAAHQAWQAFQEAYEETEPPTPYEEETDEDVPSASGEAADGADAPAEDGEAATPSEETAPAPEPSPPPPSPEELRRTELLRSFPALRAVEDLHTQLVKDLNERCLGYWQTIVDILTAFELERTKLTEIAEKVGCPPSPEGLAKFGARVASGLVPVLHRLDVQLAGVSENEERLPGPDDGAPPELRKQVQRLRAALFQVLRDHASCREYPIKKGDFWSQKFLGDNVVVMKQRKPPVRDGSTHVVEVFHPGYVWGEGPTQQQVCPPRVYLSQVIAR